MICALYFPYYLISICFIFRYIIPEQVENNEFIELSTSRYRQRQLHEPFEPIGLKQTVNQLPVQYREFF